MSAGNATLATTAGTSIAGTGIGTFGTDDTTAIQAAITAATAAGGGLIVLPTGIFVITYLTWASKVSMTGNGWGKSILKFISTADMNKAVILGTSGSATVPYTDCQFTNFEVDAAAATMAVPSFAGKAFFIQYMVRGLFQNLYVHDSPATGLGIDFLQNTTIDSCVVENCGRLNPPTGGAGIGIGIGATGTFPERVNIIGNTVLGGKSYCIFFETQTGAVITAANIVGSVVGNNVVMGTNTLYGIGDTGCTDFLCVGNNVRGVNGNGVGITVKTGTLLGFAGIRGIISSNIVNGLISGNGISIDYTNGGDPGQYCGYVVEGNTVESCSNGILIFCHASTTMDSLNISDNNVRNNNSAGIVSTGNGGVKDLVIKGNICANNGKTTGTTSNRAGISLKCPVTRLRMIGNVCYENDASSKQLYGLIVDTSAVTGAFISGNDFSNNATGAIQLSGGGTIAGTVTNNKGYNPIGISAVTPGASPWTYTAGNTPEILYLMGGTVSAVVKGGITLATALSATDSLPIALSPGETVVTTYTVVPTANKDQQ